MIGPVASRACLRALSTGVGLVLALAVAAVAAASPQSARSVRPDAPAYEYDIVVDGTVSSPELVLENVGEAPVGGISLVADGRDLTTLDGILASIFRPGMTDEQRARAIWDFARTQTYAWWPYSDYATESPDPVRHVNSYGYGLCSDFTDMMITMYRRAGFRVRRWHPGTPSAHVVPEVFFDGDWHVMDANRDILFLERDNRTIASVEDLVRDPWLTERAGPLNADLAALYAATPLDAFTEAAAEGPTVALRYALRPGERLRFHAGPLGGFRSDTLQTTDPPPLYGNATLATRLDGAAPTAAALLESGASLAPSSGSSPAVLTVLPGAAAGEALYRVHVPHPLVAASLALTAHVSEPGDSVTVYAGQSGTSLRFDESSLSSGQVFTHQSVAEASGFVTAEEDGWLPHLHVDGMSEGRLVFRVQRDADSPLHIAARFYRWSPLDVLGIDVSDDGVSWTSAYTPDPWHLGYFDIAADATALVSDRTEVFVRFRLVPVTAPRWTVGLSRIQIHGVRIEPHVEVAAFRTPGTSTVQVDLGPVVAPARGPANYTYALRVVVESAGGRSGLVNIETANVLQVAPRALPHPKAGLTRFGLAVREGNPRDLHVLQTWTEAPAAQPLAPVAPLAPAPGGAAVLGDSLLLAWAPAAGFPSDQVLQYQVRICADEACDTPLTSLLEVATGFRTAGSDGLLPSPDDVVAPSGMPMARVPYVSWLTPGRTYYWRVRTQSIAGDWSEFGPAWSFVAATAATTPPVLAIEAPLPHQTLTSPLVTLAGTVGDDTGEVTIRWATDRGQSGVLTANSDWSVPDVPLGGGWTRVFVTATDSDGNSVVTSSSFHVPYISYLLAEGTTGGDFRTEVVVANPTQQDAAVEVHFLTSSGEVVTQPLTVASLRRTTLVANDVPEIAGQSFGIEVRSLQAVPLMVERAVFWGEHGKAGHSAGAAPSLSRAWYFAEGAQGFFDTFLLLANPQDVAAVADVAFLTEGGLRVDRRLEVPARGRTTLWARDVAELEDTAFSITVLADQPLVAERAMYFGGDRWTGGHVSHGLATPGRRWFSAEGATGPYFDTYILVGNPSPDRDASLDVRFLKRSGEVVERAFTVRPEARLTINLEAQGARLEDAEVSTVVQSDVPVVVERATFWGGAFPNWLDGHSAPASTASALKWGVADARVGGPEAFETWVLITNEHASLAAEVEMVFLPEAGTPTARNVTVPPNSRYNVWLEYDVPELVGQRVGVRLESVNRVPIVVERAMYWSTPQQPWAGGSSTLGVPLP